MSEKPSVENSFLHQIEMGVGAWAWGDKLFWNYGSDYNDKDIEAAFQVSLEGGVNLVDTAEAYGQGRSERLLGQFIHNSQQPVLVATKFFPFPWRFTKTSVVKALRRSLDRLQLDKVDLYQLHWPSPLVPFDTFVGGLALVVESGLSRAVGISNYDNGQMQRAYNILIRHNIQLASNQVEYHLLNRKVEKNGVLEQCKKLGVRLIAYSPLSKGLLTGKYTSENPPPGLRGRMYGSILGNLQGLIGVLTEIGQQHGGKTSGQVALNWLICKGAMPIPGIKNRQQAIENLGATGWRLTDDEVRVLDDASDQFTS